MITIYHNTRCGKSRKACAFADENNKGYTTYEYLKEGLSKSQLSEILEKGNYAIADIMRKGETVFKENFKGKDLNDAELIKAIIENPILLQRPIAVGKDFALILRDDEAFGIVFRKK